MTMSRSGRWWLSLLVTVVGLATLGPGRALAEGVLQRCPPEQYDPARCSPPEPASAPTSPAPSTTSRGGLRPERHLFWSMRMTPGIGIYPRRDNRVLFDLDFQTGPMLAVTWADDFMVALVPELGYSYHAGEQERGSYLVVGLRHSFGSPYLLGAIFSAVLVGTRDGRFDVGVRNGVQVGTLLGLLMLEVAHELRMDGADELHSVRITVSLDLGLLSTDVAEILR